MRAKLHTSVRCQFEIFALVNVLRAVGLNQLQQAGKRLGKEEVETARGDHSFRKLGKGREKENRRAWKAGGLRGGCFRVGRGV